MIKFEIKKEVQMLHTLVVYKGETYIRQLSHDKETETQPTIKWYTKDLREQIEYKKNPVLFDKLEYYYVKSKNQR